MREVAHQGFHCTTNRSTNCSSYHSAHPNMGNGKNVCQSAPPHQLHQLLKDQDAIWRVGDMDWLEKCVVTPVTFYIPGNGLRDNNAACCCGLDKSGRLLLCLKFICRYDKCHAVKYDLY